MPKKTQPDDGINVTVLESGNCVYSIRPEFLKNGAQSPVIELSTKDQGVHALTRETMKAALAEIKAREEYGQRVFDAALAFNYAPPAEKALPAEEVYAMFAAASPSKPADAQPTTTPAPFVMNRAFQNF